MKFQLLEAFHGGHHTNYIEAMLPAIRNALNDGRLSEALISITPKHYQLLAQAGLIKREDVNLKFSASIIEVSPAPSFKERYQLYKSFDAAIKANEPDAFVCTSADYDIMMNALMKDRLFGSTMKTKSSAGIIHYGFPDGANISTKDKIKKHVYEACWQHSSWKRLLIVNPLTYESLKNRKDALSKRVALLPDPVPPKLDVDIVEARQRLNIPEDGLYIGFVGMMDMRKAIPELLAAFVEAKAYESSRLLLAGSMYGIYAKLLEEKYADLVAQKRIVVLNRYLSNEEVQLAYASIDVKALLQYRRMNLSANLLKAVSYGKPIITDDYGYTGEMTKRFDLGYLCNVNQLKSIVTAISNAIANHASFKPSQKTEKLIKFHHPDNYTETVFNQLKMSQDGAQQLSWEWVCAEDA